LCRDGSALGLVRQNLPIRDAQKMPIANAAETACYESNGVNESSEMTQVCNNSQIAAMRIGAGEQSERCRPVRHDTCLAWEE
jgi:hypothetical protein